MRYLMISTGSMIKLKKILMFIYYINVINGSIKLNGTLTGPYYESSTAAGSDQPFRSSKGILIIHQKQCEAV